MTGSYPLDHNLAGLLADIRPPTIVWGARNWFPVAIGVALVVFALLAWSYARSPAGRGVRFLAATLKFLGVLILALCLAEPLFSGTRARPGANVFVVLGDNSQSMTLRDGSGDKTRGDQLKGLAGSNSSWLKRLSQDFDLRQYSFDSQLRPVDQFDDLKFDGDTSSIGSLLDRLDRRYKGRPVAGVFLLTDGNATDAEALDQFVTRAASAEGKKLPAIYPLVVGSGGTSNDLSLSRVSVTQTNFEDAPVTLTAHVTGSGYAGQTVVAQCLDETGAVAGSQKVKMDADGTPAALRFQLRPTQSGVSFYRVRVAGESNVAQFDSPEKSPEATLQNNTQLVTVDRRKGPYRVLYVAGRPNWEYKFLNRSVRTDDQVQLVGLIRVAKREPKFNFLSRTGEQSNPLFRGFDPKEKDAVEQYDQPVLVRQNTVDEDELRGGFPKTSEDLFRYHAIILDDVESEFFTQDQMQLLKEFVRTRGGGLLMLGGQESFKNGRYDQTPMGDLLPVYADEVPATPPAARYRLALTREGWLEPWVRLRGDEETENKRLASMPNFQTVNQVRGIKPGATVLARAQVNNGSLVPALVEQRFGKGRTAALLVGDLWRWGLHRPADAEYDMEKAWRQAIRWLVAEVPQRVEVTVTPRKTADDPEGALTVAVNVRDPAFAPLDNASVTVRVTPPDGKTLDLRAEPSEKQAGLYEALYVSRAPGAYRAEVIASAPDGSEVGRTPSGWTSQPALEEFRDLKPNVALLERIAKATGGEVVDPSKLDAFVADLPTRRAEITEPYIQPLWHRPWVFLMAMLCLTAEWGLRRWKGLP